MLLWTLVTVQLFGPASSSSCNFILFLTRFAYILLVSLTGMHQILRYLYIFKWTHVAYLNENFFGYFLTFDVFILSLFFAFMSYFHGHHKYSIEYYLCIGQKPTENESFELHNEEKFKDPIHIFSFVMFSLIIALALQILFYSHKNTIFKKLKLLFEALKLGCCIHNTLFSLHFTNGPIS